MKKNIIILLLTILLVNSIFIHTYSDNYSDKYADKRNYSKPDNEWPDSSALSSTRVADEGDDFGGDLFDNFENRDGLEYLIKTQLDGGRIRLSDNELGNEGDLSGLWHFNGGNQTASIEDSSANGHMGNVFDRNDNGDPQAKGQQGKFGNAIFYSENYVKITEADILDNDDIGTLSFWVQHKNNEVEKDNPFFSYTQTDGEGNKESVVSFLVDSDGHIRIQYLKNPQFMANMESDYRIIDEQWHNIVFTSDGFNNCLYIDGDQMQVTKNNFWTNGMWFDDIMMTTIPGISRHIEFGRHFEMDGEDHLPVYFDGSIDETAIYTRVLSSGEIEENYKTYAESGLVSSKKISREEGATWDRIYVNSQKPENTDLLINIIEGNTGEAMDNYTNITNTVIDVSGIQTDCIILRALLKGNGMQTPILKSWGLEWIKENAWRDSFSGIGRIDSVNSNNISIRGGQVQLGIQGGTQTSRGIKSQGGTEGSRNTGEFSRYIPDGDLFSEVIGLPDNMVWGNVSFYGYAPLDTSIEVSVLDGNTGEHLLRIEGQSLDISNINPMEHNSLILMGHLHTENVLKSPILTSWGLNWTKALTPKLLENIETIHIEEDSETGEIFNFSGIFYDHYSHFQPPEYRIEYISDPGNISLEILGTVLNMLSLANNFSDEVQVYISCSTIYGISTFSNTFAINISNNEDGPVWKLDIPDVSFDEDTHSQTIDLEMYVYDAENSECAYHHIVENPNVTVEIDEDNNMNIFASENWAGSTSVRLSVFQVDRPDLNSTQTFMVNVMAMNDYPEVHLLSPENGTTRTKNIITLSWTGKDPDSTQIEYQVYLSSILDDVSKHKVRALVNTTQDMTYTLELNKGTYYWNVVGFDEYGNGTEDDNYYFFNITGGSNVPDISLNYPGSGAIINGRNVTLEWGKIELEGIIYKVKFGEGMDLLEDMTNTDNSHYNISGLVHLKTYYWTVIPILDGITGDCGDGVWNFTVDLSFREIYNISISTSTNNFNVIRGTICTLNYHITNHGNNPETISLHYNGGLLQNGVINPSDIYLNPGQTKDFFVQISINEDIVISDYPIDIVASIRRGNKIKFENTHSIILSVERENVMSDGPEHRTTLVDFLKNYWELPVVIVSGLVALTGYFQFKKRKGKFKRIRLEIETIYLKMNNVEKAMASLNKVSEKLINYMDKDKISDNQYLILENKINDYQLQLRSRNRINNMDDAVKMLPPAVREKVVNMLEDGKVSRDEFDDFRGTIWNLDISSEKKQELGSMVVQWLHEDTGETVEWKNDDEMLEDTGGKVEESIRGISPYNRNLHMPRDKGESDKLFEGINISQTHYMDPTLPPQKTPAEVGAQKYSHQSIAQIPVPNILLPEEKDVSRHFPNETEPILQVALPSVTNVGEITKYLTTGPRESPEKEEELPLPPPPPDIA